MDTTQTDPALVRRGWPGSAIAVAVILGIAAIIGWYEARAHGNEAASANSALQTQTTQNQAMTTRLAAAEKAADMTKSAQASLSQAQAALAAEQAKTAAQQQQISQMQAQSTQQQAQLQDRIAQLQAAPPQSAATTPPPGPSNLPSHPQTADTSALTPPELPAGATGRDYLVAAQQAIEAGNPGKAQAALGRAETRYLNGEQLSSGRHRHPQIAGIETALRQLGQHSNDAATHTLNAMLSRHTM